MELLVALAVVGVLAGIGVSLLPREGMAVTQGQRIMASAVQFGRFEAIKRNFAVEVTFPAGATEIVVRREGGIVLRRFPLDPQASRVTVQSVDPNGTITFNARGVAVSPISRTVVIGIPGREAHDRTLIVSGQGAVRSGS